MYTLKYLYADHIEIKNKHNKYLLFNIYGLL